MSSLSSLFSSETEQQRAAGSLPWSGLDAKTQEEKYRRERRERGNSAWAALRFLLADRSRRKIREKKEQTPLDELCAGLRRDTDRSGCRRVRRRGEFAESLCPRGFPPAFKIYLQTARSLEFKALVPYFGTWLLWALAQERPDYVALRKLFADVRAEIGPQEELPRYPQPRLSLANEAKSKPSVGVN